MHIRTHINIDMLIYQTPRGHSAYASKGDNRRKIKMKNHKNTTWVSNQVKETTQQKKKKENKK